MSKQQLIYVNVTPISSTEHKGFSVKGEGHLKFAAEVNSVPVTASEILQVAQELPVVFSGADELVPVVIMGMRDNENLAINADGKWQGRYVPAFLRRYPFIFAGNAENSQLTLCVDDSYAGWNSDDKGERLFDSEGAQTQYLQGVVKFLQDYQTQLVRTQAFCKRIKELDLLEPVTANFQMAEGDRVSLGGFQAISKSKLKALPQETLMQMFAADELELIYQHLFSLGRFNHLIDLSNKTAQD